METNNKALLLITRKKYSIESDAGGCITVEMSHVNSQSRRFPGHVTYQIEFTTNASTLTAEHVEDVVMALEAVQEKEKK